MAGNIARGNDLGIGQSKLLKAITIAGIIFLLLPLIVLIIFSFNESKIVAKWTGFSLKWYKVVLEDGSLWTALKNSLIIAIVSTFFSTILGTMGALLLAKYKFKGKALFQNVLYIPIILPEIIFGISLLALFLLINFPLGLFSIICAHITFSFSFVTIIIYGKVINLPPSLEEASLDLGANRIQTFKNVIFPNILPGIIAGAIFAFTMSLDNFVVSFFTAGIGSSTLPLKIYSLIKFGINPSINAISTILIVFTVLALYFSNFLQKNQRISKKLKTGLLLFVITLIGLLIIIPLFKFNKQQLHIYNFSYYLDEEIVKDFEKETGIDVTIDYYNDNEEMLSRLNMGVSGYDVIFPSAYMVKTMIGRGLLAQINYDNIPNYRYTSSSFRKMPYDTTGKYYIPYTYGFTGIVYNSNYVKDSIDSWTDLWDPKYSGKITMVDEMRETFYIAYKLLGCKFGPDTTVLYKARDLLIKQKPLLKKYDSNTTDLLMTTEQIWIAQTWNGIIARLNDIDPKFKLGMPSEGVLFWSDNICIPASSLNKENAEKFINYLYSPENAARNMKTIKYAMPHNAGRQLLDSSIRNNKIIFPEIKDTANLNMIEDLGWFLEYLDRAWTEVKVN